MPTADAIVATAQLEAERRSAATGLRLLGRHLRRYHPLINPAPGACDVCDWIQRQLDRPS